MPSSLTRTRLDIADGVDQRVRLHDIRWQEYEALLGMRGDRSGPRIAYLEGELELMTPSFDHERLKTMLARLIEAYAEECDIDLLGCGSWTLRAEAEARGLEPDECYVLGPLAASPQRPDLAVEIAWTRGGLDKLAIYQGLGVPEVWLWQDGELHVYWHDDDTYRPSSRSRLLPGLDLRLIERLMGQTSQTRAVRELRRVLRDRDERQADS